jgi:galactokinase
MFATFSNEAKGITKEIDMIEMALLSQKAEHNFIDVKCGIMDQFASAMGKAEHAIYLNCATLEYEHIPLKIDGCKIVLTNTNVKHSLGSSKYNERRMECEQGLSALKSAMSDITQLSDVTPEEFELHKELITDPTVKKRIKHVVYECDRVKKSAEALKNNEIEKFGEFMNESHNSLQYDYEVTCPELDFVVQEGRKIDGVLGIRMTGAGFGGCTVAIIRDNAIDNYIETVKASFNKEFGHDASFYVTETGDGGREI